MEMFIDAYDWVMVPNVYAMSQFAAGTMITTKPYVSGSNYIRKMSNFKEGPWKFSWDALYWEFIRDHRELFAKNPRSNMVVVLLDRMDEERRTELHREAARWIPGRESEPGDGEDARSRTRTPSEARAPLEDGATPEDGSAPEEDMAAAKDGRRGSAEATLPGL